MCGIAGIISLNTAKTNTGTLRKMAASLSHRGPDGQAVWRNYDGIAGLGHARLSVIDRSAAASQPMHFKHHYSIVYNGEIYNYVELRNELEKKGYSFNNASDTAVILAAYAEYKETCVSYFDGMFAFALWDEEERKLFCARDRFGEKPFYYAESDGFYFGSETKAIEAAGIKGEIDNGMLLQFLVTGNTTDPSGSSRTFYRNIKKLPSAHSLSYDPVTGSTTIRRYWKADVSKTNYASEAEVIGRIDDLLTVSVTRRLRSDVPLGESLSGGLDSSGIVAMIARNGVQHLKTFTAKFPGFEKDESRKAAAVAQKFGFSNYHVELNAESLADDFTKVAYYHDTPVASAGVYAQYKVFELAAQHNVIVLLDGQGADEIFGGYDHYRHWKLRAMFPLIISRMLVGKEQRQFQSYSYIDNDFLRDAMKSVHVVKPVVDDLNDWLYFDTFSLGLEQLLMYADRNSMAHGREVRLPYLFHELVSYLFTLPSSFKIHAGYTKWVLRKLMQNKLPAEIVSMKRKIGFEPPQKQWMESRRMHEYIQEEKKRLVKEKILSKIVLDQRRSSHDAYSRNANEWRWFASSVFLHK